MAINQTIREGEKTKQNKHSFLSSFFHSSREEQTLAIAFKEKREKERNSNSVSHSQRVLTSFGVGVCRKGEVITQE